MEIPLPKCRTHKDHQCEFYCLQCDAVICGKCLVNFHNKHGVEDLEERCLSRRKIIAAERETVKNAVSLYQHLAKEIGAEEERIKEKYLIVENEIRIHGEKLEEAARKAKEEYIKRTRERKIEDLKRLEEQSEKIRGNLEEARKVEQALPESLNTCEGILSFKVGAKILPEVPKLQKIEHPEFVPNCDYLQEMVDKFGNLAI